MNIPIITKYFKARAEKQLAEEKLIEEIIKKENKERLHKLYKIATAVKEEYTKLGFVFVSQINELNDVATLYPTLNGKIFEFTVNINGGVMIKSV